jgi:hypothetical protein
MTGSEHVNKTSGSIKDGEYGQRRFYVRVYMDVLYLFVCQIVKNFWSSRYKQKRYE